jgi:hypothetical protein
MVKAHSRYSSSKINHVFEPSEPYPSFMRSLCGAVDMALPENLIPALASGEFCKHCQRLVARDDSSSGKSTDEHREHPRGGTKARDE